MITYLHKNIKLLNTIYYTIIDATIYHVIFSENNQFHNA